jgi:protein disulfide-isomerase A6
MQVFTTEGEVEDYSGGRTAAAIVKWALDKAGKTAEADEAAPEADAKEAENTEPTAVVTLTDANFEEQVTNGTDVWLIDFYAPWCGHCKTLAPKWAEASLKLEGKVKFGAVDCDSQKALQSKYEIQGYPTLKLFAPGAAAETIEPGRHTDSIVSFAEEALTEANRKPREVRELTSDEVFQEECSTSMCVVAFLPHILDTGAAGRQIYLDMIRDLAVSNKKINMGFVWAEATQQAALEARLGAGGTGYPALAAVSAKKGLNIPFFGGFTGEKIATFLERALKGKEKAKKLKKGLPELVTTTAWDGNDGEAPKEEL